MSGTTGSSVDFLVSYAGEDRDWAEWIASHLGALGYTYALQDPPADADNDPFAAAEAAVAQGDDVVVVMSLAFIDALLTSGARSEGRLGGPGRAVAVQIEPLQLPPDLRTAPTAAMHDAADDYGASRDLLVRALREVKPRHGATVGGGPRPVPLPAPMALAESYPVPAPPPGPAPAPVTAQVTGPTDAGTRADDTTLARQPEPAASRSAGLLFGRPLGDPLLPVGGPAAEATEPAEASAPGSRISSTATALVDAPETDGRSGGRGAGQPPAGDDRVEPTARRGDPDAVSDDRPPEVIDRPVRTDTAAGDSPAAVTGQSQDDEAATQDDTLSADDSAAGDTSDAADDTADSESVPQGQPAEATDLEADAAVAVGERAPATDRLAHTAGTDRVVIHIPQPRPVLFWDRAAALECLAGGLPVADSGVRVVGLVGPAGVGKSTLAAEHAARAADRLDLVWWLRAASRATLVSDVAALGTRLGGAVDGDDDHRDVVTAVRNRLADSDLRWLLVLDGVVAWSDVADVVPSSGTGQVVVTTANRSLEALDTAVELNGFDAAVATDFLLARTGRRDGDGAAEVIGRLDGSPAALELAGSYITATGVSCADYVAAVDDQASPPGLACAPPVATVESCVLASLRAVADASPGAGPALVALAEGTADVPLAHQLVAALGDADDLPLVDVLSSYGLALADGRSLVIPSAVRQALAYLVPAASVPEARQRLVDVLSGILGHDDSAASPNGKRAGDEDADNVLPHAARIVRSPDRPASPELARLAARAVSWAAAHDAPREAVALAERSVELHERAFGATDEATAAARAVLADLYEGVGETERALATQAEVLADYERAYGPDDERTRQWRTRLAASGAAAGEATLPNRPEAGANEVARPVEPGRGQHAPADGEAGEATGAGRAAGEREASKAAEPGTGRRANSNSRDTDHSRSTRRSLASRRSVAGKPNGSVPTSTSSAWAGDAPGNGPAPTSAGPEPSDGAPPVDGSRDLPTPQPSAADATAPATVAANGAADAAGRRSGRDAIGAAGAAAHDRARRLADDLERRRLELAAAEAHAGPASVEALTARHQLAMAHSDAGDHRRALDLLRTVVADCEQVLGPYHLDTLTARSNLAVACAEAGNYAEAIACQERVVADHERLLGPDDALTLTARNSLANNYASAGLHRRALQEQQKVVADYERTHGPTHPATLTAQHNLANSYADLGQHEQALQLRLHVLAEREHALGVEHPQTLGARNNLANSYADLGQHEQALRLRRDVHDRRQALLGPDHPQTLGASNNLANSYADLGRHDEAMELRLQVLRSRERVLGPDHPHTLTARNNLANSYAALGRHEQALALRERALADCERILGADHPHTATARANLASTWAALGDDERALALGDRPTEGLSPPPPPPPPPPPLPARTAAGIGADTSPAAAGRGSRLRRGATALADGALGGAANGNGADQHDATTPKRKRRFWFWSR